MSLSLMNLRMAKQDAKKLHNSLIRRKNILSLNNFEEFCNSSYCEKLIVKLRSKVTKKVFFFYLSKLLIKRSY